LASFPRERGGDGGIDHPALAKVLNAWRDGLGIHGSQLWLSTLNAMLYSHNGGRTWIRVVGGMMGDPMMAVSPSGRTYACLAGRYVVSRNDGVSWSALP
jgi:hypothetical protein